ncbi:MAG: hypothetical protein LBT00_14650 [Spirochaetaceae bacterium]|nr:hypothetical protein [Spirochaetaceae bacterium]
MPVSGAIRSSIPPSLRGAHPSLRGGLPTKQSSRGKAVTLDCRATLAMTGG